MGSLAQHLDDILLFKSAFLTKRRVGYSEGGQRFASGNIFSETLKARRSEKEVRYQVLTRLVRKSCFFVSLLKID